jgi:hypothetical protein
LSGLLVVAKEGRTAWFDDITYGGNDRLTATLSPPPVQADARLLFVPLTDSTDRTASHVRSALLKHGLRVEGVDDPADFNRLERDAGGIANRGFRAWVRAKYGGDMLLRGSVREQSRGINIQSQALAGTLKVFVEVEFDVVDLTTGEHRAFITGSASVFATQQARGFQEAFDAAMGDAGAKLKAVMTK